MGPAGGISNVFPNLPAAALAAALREEDHLEKAQRGSSSSVPRLPPPATPHTYLPPAPLPFQAWYSVCPGSSMLGSGMEAVVISLMRLSPYCLPPLQASHIPPIGLHPYRGCHPCPQPPGASPCSPRSSVPFAAFPQLPRDQSR